jgi:hypothetical protein
MPCCERFRIGELRMCDALCEDIPVRAELLVRLVCGGAGARGRTGRLIPEVTRVTGWSEADWG